MQMKRDMGWPAILMGSATAFLVSGTALAQSVQPAVPPSRDVSAGADSEAITEIIVSGSRIDRAGFEAPTPVTVVSADEIRQGQRSNIGTVLNDLPQFQATRSPATLVASIDSGTTAADLRGLGPTRTLTLLNGHRFIGSYDLNSVPLALVKRVDVVTGGASAAWGSGAVSGVVNLILDDKMEGAVFSGQFGSSSEGDGDEYRLSGAYGLGFADGRGHFMVAGEYVDNRGIAPATTRDYMGRYAVFANPGYTPTNGQHQFSILPDINSSVQSFDGVINSGVLRGQTFNSDGSLRPFQYGSTISGTLQQGGEGFSNRDFRPISPPLERYNLSAVGDYEISDHVRLHADLLYSRTQAHYGFYPESGSMTIQSDNAFLSSDVAQRLSAAGETSFSLGQAYRDFGLIDLDYSRETISGTLGLSGEFGSNWRWDAYYSHGVSTRDRTLGNIRITTNFAHAVDSVLSPVTGAPVCRIALTDPATNCVPINLFGAGSASQAAINYVTGRQGEHARQTLDVGGVSLRGEPFALPAGPVSIAFGVEAREEAISVDVTPNAEALAFTLINFSALDGSFSVNEAFGEILVPVLKDAGFIKALDFNAAGRISDYSNSGSTPSWKFGLTADLFDGFLFRAVRSRDIRSGDMNELFSRNDPNYETIIDPVQNVQVNIPTISGGNPKLDPELADTYTIGGAYTPSWAPGVTMSIDYYNIDIGGAITTISGQDILNRCVAGNSNLCGQVIRDGNGNLTSILSTFVNLTNYKTAGIDFEIGYAVPVSELFGTGDGSIRARVLATRVTELAINDGISEVDYLGNLGATSTLTSPHWRGVVGLTYQSDTTTFDLRARYIGSGVYDKYIDISNNAIAARTFVDASFEYKLPIGDSRAVSVFGAVTNLFDKDPPVLPNPIQYDVIGRYMTVGLKLNF